MKFTFTFINWIKTASWEGALIEDVNGKRYLTHTVMMWEEAPHRKYEVINQGPAGFWENWKRNFQNSEIIRPEIFIKNVVSVDVDGLRGINTYTIKAQYNVPKTAPDGFEYYELEHRLVDEFTLTWDQIEEDGGIAQVNKDLKECYGV